jgi:hypothetical protein
MPHRHSYAVMQLKRGCDHQWLKNQLGHAPQSTLICTTYGVYIGAQKLTADQQAVTRNPKSSLPIPLPVLKYSVSGSI